MVVSGSLVQFFFAWEGVGLASYLLISFWYTRVEASRAAMKAMIMNRFGDFGLYFAILLIFAFYKTLLFSSLNAIAHVLAFENLVMDLFFFQIKLHDVICFFLFVAVIGKSAQLGLHTWLPDAMEGPTPVSALLHAATMVTAGVYLLLRLSLFFEASPNILILISIWGALTAFFAATVGAFQNDIKKIIAYSTCSQLGYMVSACGLYNFIGAYYHLFNHAFFKALLFLGAGVVIHALNNEQDIRKFGGLINLLPFTFFCMLIASLSLMGFPFLSGFYSKDIIINWAFVDYSFHSRFVYWLLLFAAYFTSFYSTKLLYLTFFSTPRFSFTFLKNITESDYRFKIPLFLLAFLSFFSGYLFSDLFVGYGGDLMNLNTSIEKNFHLVEMEYLSQSRKFLPLLFVFFGFLTYFISHITYINCFSYLLKYREALRIILLPWKNFFTKKWFFDYFYYHISVKILTFAYEFSFKSIDKGLLETMFVKHPIKLIFNFSRFLESFYSASLTDYIFYIINILLTTFLLVSLLFLNYILFLMLIFYIILRYLQQNAKNR
jgi:proton-translocating NADH-quinone oxidoreductase chain L